jgi:hypothetical protein
VHLPVTINPDNYPGIYKRTEFDHIQEAQNNFEITAHSFIGKSLYPAPSLFLRQRMDSAA